MHGLVQEEVGALGSVPGLPGGAGLRPGWPPGPQALPVRPSECSEGSAVVTVTSTIEVGFWLLPPSP